jgi:hypothetical protein
MINLKEILDQECKKEFPISEIIIDVLNNKINPDHKTMDCLINKFVKSEYVLEDDEDKDKNEHTDRKMYSYLRKEKIANILCRYGYVPSKDDVLNLAKIHGEFYILRLNSGFARI